MKLSIVIPTYNEKENIKDLIVGVQKEFRNYKINGELIVVDDGSPDGTAKLVESLKKKYNNLFLIERGGKLGLSSAVLDGWKKAKGDVLGVMDADLSHPIDKIHELYEPITKGKSDFSIGTRYIRGGAIKGWNFKRKLMSRIATIFAKPFTSIHDPMSGFFMIKKEGLQGIDLNPKGFKILLEVVLKAKYKKISEIPIVFIDRQKGKSKAGFGEIIYYLKNLMGYWKYRRKVVDQFLKYTAVGAIGTVVNLLVLYFFTSIVGLYYLVSAVFAFIIAVTNNYFLNKIWTFEEKIKDKLFTKWGKFLIVSLFGLVTNLVFLWFFTEIVGLYYLVSQVIAIVSATFVNFIGNKLWTFKK